MASGQRGRKSMWGTLRLRAPLAMSRPREPRQSSGPRPRRRRTCSPPMRICAPRKPHPTDQSPIDVKFAEQHPEAPKH
eukprot:11221619-Lingulodinium_polyedra.AAC.1